MSSFTEISVAALALSVEERLNLMLLLGESLRTPLGAPKPKTRKSKSKASSMESEGEGEGAAAAGGGGAAAEKPKRAPSAGQRMWFDGLAAVRVHLKTLDVSGKHAMKVGKSLKEQPSWPNPTVAEVEAAVEEVIPEDERASAASKPTKKSVGSKSKKAAAKPKPKEEAESEDEDE
jgi:hypothetical protein